MPTFCPTCVPYKLSLSIPLDIERTVLISNFEADIDEDHLSPLFSLYGKIEYIHVFRDLEGKSKCRAVLMFANQNDVTTVLNTLRHKWISGKKLEVKEAWNRPCVCTRDFEGIVQKEDEKDLRVVFIRQLSKKTTERDLRVEFEIFGPVVKIDIMPGFLGMIAKIVYETPNAAASAVACMNGVCISNHVITAYILLGYNAETNPVLLEPDFYTVYSKSTCITKNDLIDFEKYVEKLMKPWYVDHPLLPPRKISGSHFVSGSSAKETVITTVDDSSGCAIGQEVNLSDDALQLVAEALETTSGCSETHEFINPCTTT